MTRQELKDLALAANSTEKRNAMRYVESLKLDKFYTLLKSGATLGKTHVSVTPDELGEAVYDVIKFGEAEYDRHHFLMLLGNKLESSIEGLTTHVEDRALIIEWT